MVVGRKPILQQNWLMIELTLALFKQSREYQEMLELVRLWLLRLKAWFGRRWELLRLGRLKL